MNKNKIDVYLLTKDREEYFSQSLKSILNQNYKNYQIIISDNSTNNNIQKIIDHKFFKEKSKILYLKRKKKLTLYEHVKLVFEESTAHYLVIFHDDDILYPSYLSKVLKAFNSDNEICAIGVNGRTIDENSNYSLKRKLMFKSNKNKIFSEPRSFLYQYFGYKTIGVCHHSGYMYDLTKVKKIIKSLDFSSNSNSLDVYYLSKLLFVYKILYISTPLMEVRFHKNNHNSYQSIEDRFFIFNKIRYELVKNDDFLKNSFRYCFYFIWKKNYFKKKKISIKLKIFIFRLNFIAKYYLMILNLFLK